MDETLVRTLSLALGIGLLIGFQRQRTGSGMGGIRTYSLIALLGAVCGVLAREWDVTIAAAGMLGVIALIVLANVHKAQNDQSTAGQTSEAAALLTYALGAFVAMEHYAAALVLGGVTAVLLHFKEPMHEVTAWLSEGDVRAIMRLVILSLIILPLLPDQAYGHAIYAVAVISGVVDVDAMTLSTARRGAAGRLETGSAWRVIMRASLSNVVFKTAAVLALGSAALFARMLPVALLTLGTGAALIVLWPA